MLVVAALLLLSASASAVLGSAATENNNNGNNNVRGNNNNGGVVPKGNWVSYSRTVEFLPADDEYVRYYANKKNDDDGNAAAGQQRSATSTTRRRTRDITTRASDMDIDDNFVVDGTEGLSSSPSSAGTVQLLARQLEESSSASFSTKYDEKLSRQYLSNVLAEDGPDSDQEYDEYQQAWRVLGFFIDCEDSSRYNTVNEYGYNYYDGNGNGNGSGDSGTEEGCKRYVLWAAYVDLQYQGNGIGEYQYYDRFKGQWDDTACTVTASSGNGNNNNKNNNGNRCAKMDCHLEDTHWTLLGLFKHRSPDDWMEQLFKHEGMCVWTQDEYSFMKGARKAWPQGCIKSSSKTLSLGAIYYDIKPTSGGSIKIGLYTDERCVEEYNGPLSAEQVAGNLLAEAEASGSGDNSGANYDNLSASEAQSLWDSAFDAFKICQPCVAHDLTNYGYNGGEQGESYGSYNPYDDDAKSYNGNDFDCYDDADYLNVNQCMKFMAKTYMDTAMMRDVVLAHRQGSLVRHVPVSGLKGPVRFVKAKRAMNVFGTTLYFVASIALAAYGVTVFRKARADANFAPNWNLKQPLVFA